ncbi:hypothetical protein CRG98_009726 [Punica granatum]|uniref:Protein kinase domain-containing protein n=1 Tax=Punica granatum TaxID=22663 RepID=A0A2I0KMY0_PUNGR|nr:hypothetical protein CRG98_009726 [Punica granatum]
MFRSWTDQDDHYLTENLGSVLPVNWSSSLVFDHIPEYAAPANVYRTARSLGTDRSTTTTYYLTWSFPVDPNFLYLVRLHFCEFQREISKFGDRTFEIYIASLVADSKADVIRWTGGRGVSERDKQIWRSYLRDLHSFPEVFKISSDNRNLAGQNPDPTRVPDPPQQPPERTSSSSGISKNVIAAIAAGSASGALVTMVKGTFGYLDPEYFRFHQQIEKSDVYSFGVVLLEVLCARPPVNTNLETEEIGLAGWVQSCYQNGSLDQIIDPNLKAEIKPECLEKFAETAMSCLRDEGMKRPSMNDIVWSLEHALELPEGAVQQETIALEPTSAMDGRLQGAEDTKSLPDMESEEEVLIIL